MVMLRRPCTRDGAVLTREQGGGRHHTVRQPMLEGDILRQRPRPLDTLSIGAFEIREKICLGVLHRKMADLRDMNRQCVIVDDDQRRLDFPDTLDPQDNLLAGNRQKARWTVDHQALRTDVEGYGHECASAAGDLHGHGAGKPRRNPTVQHDRAQRHLKPAQRVRRIRGQAALCAKAGDAAGKRLGQGRLLRLVDG